VSGISSLSLQVHLSHGKQLVGSIDVFDFTIYVAVTQRNLLPNDIDTTNKSAA
jgi:sRNA-binding regulator protein Hfq